MADTRYFRCDQRTRCPLGRERKTIECDSSRSYTVDGQKFVCPLSEPACERQLREIHPTSSGGPRWLLVAAAAIVLAAAGAFFLVRHHPRTPPPLPAKKPALQIANLAGAVVGKFFEFPIRNAGGPATLRVENLPAGLSLDSTSAKIIGIPKQAGKSRLRIIAENSAGSDFGLVNLVVGAAPPPPFHPPVPLPSLPPPHFTSAARADATAGQEFSYRIAAQPMPDTVEIAGLPGWLQFDSKQMLISGTPRDAGELTLAITGRNGGGSDTLRLSIRIAEDQVASPQKPPEKPVIEVSPDQAYHQTSECFGLLEQLGRQLYNRALADELIENAVRRQDGAAVDDYQRMKAGTQKNIQDAEASYLQSVHVLATYPDPAVEAALARWSNDIAKFNQPLKEKYVTVLRAHLNLLQDAHQLGARWQDEILQLVIDDSPPDSPLRKTPPPPQP